MNGVNPTESAAAQAGLRWWTWVLPALVAFAPPHWHLPLPVGIMLAHFWGPRVLAGTWAGTVLSARLFGPQPWLSSIFLAVLQTAGVFCAWLLFSRISIGKDRPAEAPPGGPGTDRVASTSADAEKMAAIGTLASGIAHEINNPNGAIRLGIEALQPLLEDMLRIVDEYRHELGDLVVGHLSYEEARREIPQVMEGILAGSARVARIVHDLSEFADQQEPAAMRPGVRINHVVQSAVDHLANTIRSSTTRFQAHYDESLPPVVGNAQRLERVVANLLLNACQALPAIDRAVEVTTRFDEKESAAVIEVRDEGTGIPEAIRGRITDPFFTTRRAQGGTGLGLAVSASIMAQHRGRLEFDSKPGAGTIARAVLPCSGVKEKPYV